MGLGQHPRVRSVTRALLVPVFAAQAGCATLGGTTRHFEETSDGPSRVHLSQRVPASDRIEVTADVPAHSAAIRARVFRVQACEVSRGTPRVSTTTTTRTANRSLFGAEMTLTIVGAVITAAALSSAATSCSSGNPDTCDIGKATGFLAGAATLPLLVSTVTDLALTGGTQRSTVSSTFSAIQSVDLEECGRKPANGVHATLSFPNGEVAEQVSTGDGTLLFVLTPDQVASFGSNFDAKLSVEGAPPVSIAVRLDGGSD